MFFLASKLFTLFAAPSHLLALTVLVSALLLATRYRVLGRRLLYVSAAALVLIGVLPTYVWLMRPLEDQFPRKDWPARVDGVLVLGGGQDTHVLAARGVGGPNSGNSRLLAANELARRYPGAKILFSGGSGEIQGSPISEAQVARHVFGQIGLDPARLILEDRSRNIFENIAFSRRLAKPVSGESWLLVTSAIQMPRAMAVARRQGWSLRPWPSDYQTAPGSWAGIFNVPGNLGGFDAAFHEWLGLAVYRVRGMAR